MAPTRDHWKMTLLCLALGLASADAQEPARPLEPLAEIHGLLRRQLARQSPDDAPQDVLLQIDRGLGKGSMHLLLRRSEQTWSLRKVAPLPDAVSRRAIDLTGLDWKDGRIAGAVLFPSAGRDEQGDKSQPRTGQSFELDLQVQPIAPRLVVRLERFAGRDAWEIAFARKGDTWVFQRDLQVPRALRSAEHSYSWRVEDLTVDQDGRFSGTIHLEYQGKNQRVGEGYQRIPPKVHVSGRLVAGRAGSTWRRTAAAGKGLLGTGQDRMTATIETGTIAGSYVSRGPRGEWMGTVVGARMPVPANPLEEVDFLDAIPVTAEPQDRCDLAARLYREIRAMHRAARGGGASLADAAEMVVVPVPKLDAQDDARTAAAYIAGLARAAARLGTGPDGIPIGDADLPATFGPWFGRQDHALPASDSPLDYQPEGPQQWQAMGGWSIVGPFPLPDHRPQVLAPEVQPVDSLTYQRRRFFTEQDDSAGIVEDLARWRQLPAGQSRVQAPPRREHSSGTTRYFCWYARTTIRSAEARTVWMGMRLNGQATVWINGRPVWQSGYEHRSPNAVRFPARLDKGPNEILVRCASNPASNDRHDRIHWFDGHPYWLLGRMRFTFFELSACTRGRPEAAANPTSRPTEPPQPPAEPNRGDGAGVWPDASGPLAWSWDHQTNIAWRTDLPHGTGEPVVRDGRIYLTAEPNRLLCLDLATGKILWQRAVETGTARPPAIDDPDDLRKHHSAPVSPIVTQDAVFAVFGTGAAARFDLEGNAQWTVDTGARWDQPNMGSPVLVGDLLIAQVHLSKKPEDRFALVALSTEDGKRRWTARGGRVHTISEHDRAFGLGNGLALMHLTDGRKRRSLVITGDGGVVDAATGGVLHRRVFDIEATRAAPVVSGDTVYAASVEGQQAVRLWLESNGNVGARSLWRTGPNHGRGQAKTVTHWGSKHWMPGPVIRDGRMYVVRIDSAHVPQHYMCPWTQLELFDVADGRRLLRRRAVLRNATDPTIPPAIAGDRLYLADGGAPVGGFGGTTSHGQMAVLTIHESDPQPELHVHNGSFQGRWGLAPLATRNKIGRGRARPVFAGDRMLLRSFDGITCIRAESPRGRRYQLEQMARVTTDLLLGPKPQAPDILDVGGEGPVRPGDPDEVCPVGPGAKGGNWLLLGPLPAALKPETIAEAVAPTGGALPTRAQSVRIDGKQYVFDRVGADMYLPDGKLNSLGALGGDRTGHGIFATLLECRRTQTLLYKPNPAVQETWIDGKKVQPGDRIRFHLGRYPMVVRVEHSALPGFMDVARLTLGLARAPLAGISPGQWNKRVELMAPRLRQFIRQLPGTTHAQTARVQLLGAGLEAPADPAATQPDSPPETDEAPRPRRSRSNPARSEPSIRRADPRDDLGLGGGRGVAGDRPGRCPAIPSAGPAVRLGHIFCPADAACRLYCPAPYYHHAPAAMNVRVIKTFCDLVETGSFSEAAKINNVSQSAVSQQVAALEGELATQLLCRGGPAALPTEAGQAFYNGGKEIAGRFERMLAEMRAADDAERGVLRIGTIYSVGFYILDELIRDFLSAHPDTDLHIEYTHWNHINAAVLRGEMDLGVVAWPQRHRSLEIFPMTDEQLVLACAPEHPLAGAETVEPSQLNGQRFVAFLPNIPTRKHIDKLLRAAKAKPEIALEFDNVETLKRAVEVNAGLSILPEATVADEVEDGYLCSARLERPEQWIRKLGIIRRRGKEPAPAEQEFFDLIRRSDKTTIGPD